MRSVQLTERRCRCETNAAISGLTKDLKLSVVACGIFLVAPAPSKAQPVHRTSTVVCGERIGASIVLVVERGLKRIPEDVFCSMIFKYAPRQVEVRDRVVVRTAYGIVCMRTVRGKGDWAQVVGVLLCDL